MKTRQVVIASLIAFAFGYFLFGFLGDKSIYGVERIRVEEVILPVLTFSCFGVVVGVIGVLRNRRNLVEVDINQIFPYAFVAIGYLVAHFINNGFARLSDAGIAGVSLMVTLCLIGSIKNAILFLHNKVNIKNH